jgi:hypothetical protein
MATKSKPAVNPLAALAGKATKKAAPKKDNLDQHIMTGDEGAAALTCIGLNVTLDKLGAANKSRVDELKDKLFDVWTENMWTAKSQPQNLKLVVKDTDGRDDGTMTFQVQFRADGLKGVFPDELPEGKSIQDLIQEALTSEAVGLSETNALGMLKEEDGDIVVTQQVGLADTFDKLLASKDEDVVKSATKYMTLALCDDKATVKLLNDDDRSRLFVTRQIVLLKDGFFERACGYCRNVGELRKLMRFLKVKLVAGNFAFAVTSTEKDRVTRLEAIAREFVAVSDE